MVLALRCGEQVQPPPRRRASMAIIHHLLTASPPWTGGRTKPPHEPQSGELDQMGRLRDRSAGTVDQVDRRRNAQCEDEGHGKRHHPVCPIRPPGNEQERHSECNIERGLMPLEMDPRPRPRREHGDDVASDEQHRCPAQSQPDPTMEHETFREARHRHRWMLSGRHRVHRGSS